MTVLNSYAGELARFWEGKILWQCPLDRFTTLKVGGPADAVLFAEKTEDLRRLLQWLRTNNIPWLVIGRGSNILVPDEGFHGIVIVLGKAFAAIEPLFDAAAAAENKKLLIQAGAACPLAKLVNWCSSFPPLGLSGLEFAYGIPGSVGGGIIMNAGAWGMELGEIIHSITSLDQEGNIITEKNAELNFTYRGWSRKAGKGKRVIILSGIFALTAAPKDKIKASCRKYGKSRRVHQPLGMASAGSFFKNPPTRAAGRLIEEAGLKGHKIGGAMVSSRHANFIVNTGNATAKDIMNLMQEVQTRVFNSSGIMLEPEVHIL